MSKGITVKKEEDFSEWYTQVVSPEGAGLADNRYDVKGCIVHLPWGFKIARQLYRYLEKEVEGEGHEPMMFPLFINKENLDKEEDHSGFAPEVFWVTEAGSNKLDEKLALRPTGETQIYPVYSTWLRSHAQLPMKYYQSRHMAYRYETHARPFLRGREFMFFETHNMFRTHKEALDSIESDKKIMEDVITKKLKIPFKFFRRPSWDSFLGAENTYVADTVMPDGRRSQLSSTHDLGTNFAEAFDILYADENGEQNHPYQTCFGPGIWRIIAALVGIHGDNTGLLLPKAVAPHQVVITPILFDDEEVNKEIIDVAEEIKENSEYRVHIDTRDKNPGWKFNQWEMKGVPLRVEIGPRDLKNKSVVLAKRTGGKQPVPLQNVDNEVRKKLEEVDKDIERRAETYFEDKTHRVTSLEGVKKHLEDGDGFVIAPFIGVEGDEAEKWSEVLQEKVPGAQVCGVDPENNEKLSEKCIVSGEEATCSVYIAKSY